MHVQLYIWLALDYIFYTYTVKNIIYIYADNPKAENLPALEKYDVSNNFAILNTQKTKAFDIILKIVHFSQIDYNLFC